MFAKFLVYFYCFYNFRFFYGFSFFKFFVEFSKFLKFFSFFQIIFCVYLFVYTGCDYSLYQNRLYQLLHHHTTHHWWRYRNDSLMAILSHLCNLYRLSNHYQIEVYQKHCYLDLAKKLELDLQILVRISVVKTFLVTYLDLISTKCLLGIR